jgi:hypothetical protein
MSSAAARKAWATRRGGKGGATALGGGRAPKLKHGQPIPGRFWDAAKKRPVLHVGPGYKAAATRKYIMAWRTGVGID